MNLATMHTMSCGELKTEEQPAAQKKMSIADRANLAKRLDEEEASSEEEEENQK